jgi:hypothetical protein
MLTPVCPDCGRDIGLVAIEPAAPGHDLRTFECAGCGYLTLAPTKIALIKHERRRVLKSSVDGFA